MYQKGVIEEIFPEKQVSERFKTRRFVLLIPDNSNNEKKYDQFVMFETINKNTELLQHFKAGDKVTCHFRLKGNKKENDRGETQYFTQIECFNIELV